MKPRDTSSTENPAASIDLSITIALQQAVENEHSSISFADVRVPGRPAVNSNIFKRRKRLLIIIAICVAIFPTAGYSYYNHYSINDLFTELKFKMDHPPVDNEQVLVTYNSESFVIAKDFLFYKMNLEGISKLNGLTPHMTNKQILDEIIGNKLFYQYVIDQGYTASMDEIKAQIIEMRQVLALQENSQEAKDFMDRVINLMGLTEEEYWQSPEVIQAYREMIVVNKLFKEEPIYDINSFKRELLNKNKGSLKINKKVLTALSK